jgi:hypothetical protein
MIARRAVAVARNAPQASLGEEYADVVVPAMPTTDVSVTPAADLAAFPPELYEPCHFANPLAVLIVLHLLQLCSCSEGESE